MSHNRINPTLTASHVSASKSYSVSTMNTKLQILTLPFSSTQTQMLPATLLYCSCYQTNGFISAFINSSIFLLTSSQLLAYLFTVQISSMSEKLQQTPQLAFKTTVISLISQLTDDLLLGGPQNQYPTQII